MIEEGQYGDVYVIVASNINPEYAKKHGPNMFLLETRSSETSPWETYDQLPPAVAPNVGGFRYNDKAAHLTRYKVVLPYKLYCQYMNNEYGEIFP